jgi:hypothetical protein
MTPRFKWFGLTSIHPLAEMIQEKFTINKMEYKRQYKEKPLKSKISIHPHLIPTQQRRPSSAQKCLLRTLPLKGPNKALFFFFQK